MKPLIVVSRCLGFDQCRYDGIMIDDELIEQLKPLVEFRTVCPELAIGLGVPRDPIRVIRQRNQLRLVQPATGRDLSDEMNAFCRGFIASLGDVDGFILKSRSPSCGPKDVKIYSSMEKGSVVAKGAGFFAARISESNPWHPVEDEGRLKNYQIREHFLTSIFAIARLRAAYDKKMAGLVQFHAEHKFTLMAYDQNRLRKLGRIVANPERKKFNTVFELYYKEFIIAMHTPPRSTSHINVLTHGLGYFSNELKAGEKKFFLDQLKKFRNTRIPLSALLTVMASWIARFDQQYLTQQKYFAPYPEELISVLDSGKGRTT